MPKINLIKSARKAKQCGKCGKAINPGDPYRFWGFRYGGTRARCMDFSCSPRPSELTNNDFYQQYYSIQEGLEDECSRASAVNDPTGAIEQIENACSDLNSLYEEVTEKIDNMEQYFQGGDSLETLRERQSNLEMLKDDAESKAQELRDRWEEEQLDPTSEPEDVSNHEDWDQEETEWEEFANSHNSNLCAELISQIEDLDWSA